MGLDVDGLLKMSREQLDELFTNSPAGEIPDGSMDGTVLLAPGTVCTHEIAQCLRLFAWQGKVFDAGKGRLKNRVSVLGVRAVPAKVSKGPSWHDDKECIIIDYSETSLLAHWIRDEMRLVGPELFLGKVYWGKTPLPLHFALVPAKPSSDNPDEKDN